MLKILIGNKTMFYWNKIFIIVFLGNIFFLFQLESPSSICCYICVYILVSWITEKGWMPHKPLNDV